MSRGGEGFRRMFEPKEPGFWRAYWIFVLICFAICAGLNLYREAMGK